MLYVYLFGSIYQDYYTQSIARVGIRDDPAPISKCLGTFFFDSSFRPQLDDTSGPSYCFMYLFFSLYLSLSVEIRLKVAGKTRQNLNFYWPTSHDAQNTWPIDTIDKILKVLRIEKKQHRKFVRSCITGAHPHLPLAKNPEHPKCPRGFDLWLLVEQFGSIFVQITALITNYTGLYWLRAWQLAEGVNIHGMQLPSYLKPPTDRSSNILCTYTYIYINVCDESGTRHRFSSACTHIHGHGAGHFAF